MTWKQSCPVRDHKVVPDRSLRWRIDSLSQGESLADVSTHNFAGDRSRVVRFPSKSGGGVSKVLYLAEEERIAILELEREQDASAIMTKTLIRGASGGKLISISCARPSATFI